MGCKSAPDVEVSLNQQYHCGVTFSDSSSGYGKRTEKSGLSSVRVLGSFKSG